MVRGFSSPTGRRPEPKQAFKTPCDDHDQSILSCQNHMQHVLSDQPERVQQTIGRGWPRLEAALRLIRQCVWLGLLEEWRSQALAKLSVSKASRKQANDARACFVFDAGSLAEDADGERRAAAVTMGDSGLHRAAQKGDCVPRLCLDCATPLSTPPNHIHPTLTQTL